MLDLRGPCLCSNPESKKKKRFTFQRLYNNRILPRQLGVRSRWTVVAMASLGGSFGNTAPLKGHKSKKTNKYAVPGAGAYNHADTAAFKFSKSQSGSFGGKMAKMDRGATGYLAAAHKFRAPVSFRPVCDVFGLALILFPRALARTIVSQGCLARFHPSGPVLPISSLGPRVETISTSLTSQSFSRRAVVGKHLALVRMA
jgi:hypothetical protein